MIKTHLILVAALSALLTPLQAADTFLVPEGLPRAEIIIAETPQRSVRLAAQELQDSVEKISGAKLPIAMTPSADVPVQIYVGRSSHTDRLNVTANGLQHGAYRIVSGVSVVAGDCWVVTQPTWLGACSLVGSVKFELAVVRSDCGMIGA